MTTPIPKLNKEQIDRFWNMVDIGESEKCWNWKHTTNKWGYGRVKFDHHQFGAHRVAWALANRTDPGDQLICHTCDNPLCCNPKHLFLGNHSTNALDATRKGRWHSNAGENHGLAKLTESDIADIRSMYLRGYSQKTIAEVLNIHQSTVSRIMSHKRWSHL